MLGCVTPIGDQGSDIAKTAAIAAGLPDTVAGVQVNRFCASGLEAVNLAAQKVRSGFEDFVLAGGVESMSRVPMGSDGGAWAMDPITNYDTGFVPQGMGADLLATIEGFSRSDVDAFAVESQARAADARERGYFSRSIVPVLDQNGLVVLAAGRVHQTQYQLGGDRQAPTLISDDRRDGGLRRRGASEIPLSGSDRSRSYGRQLLGHRRRRRPGFGRVGLGRQESRPRAARPHRLDGSLGSRSDDHVDGARSRGKKALAKAGLEKGQIDLWEVNEAFASVVLRFMREMELPRDIVNVNGGAIAMGHPLGATGAMILGTLLDELERRDLRYGLCTLCVGGGMGIATIVERLRRRTRNQ